MKLHHFMIICLLGITHSLTAQVRESLSLQESYIMLADRYPLLQNAGLQQGIETLSLQQLKRDRLPSITFKTEGQYQSQSVQLEAEGAALPFEIDQPLYSIRSYVEANYLLYDGGLSAAQQNLTKAQTQVALQQTEVDRYSLQQQINQLFIGILLLRDQASLIDLSLADLQARKMMVQAGVNEGTLIPAELSQLSVRELELEALQDDLKWQEKGLIGTLGQLLGLQLSDSVSLNLPELSNPGIVPGIQRPEQKLFQLQRESVLAQEGLIRANRRPKFSLFAQGGLGAPNPLNILDQDPALYGVIGAGFSWKIFDWQKSRTDREILALQARQVEQQQATFEFTLNTREASYLASIERLQRQLRQDQEIATLQTEILEQAAAQLDEGVITSSEYLQRVNDELRARQNLSIHQTELLQTQVEFWNERGAIK